ncbi:MAG: M18 family aminopeptidase [Clostridia bacterium]|nr:M18 family aminopeptidase [Clostridia bacterium]
MINALTEFLKNSLTAYHATDNAKALLLDNGFKALSETDDWELKEGGKYFVERGGSALIAFTVGDLNAFAYKIVASHTDSPALKVKENPEIHAGAYTTLNVEKYGGGIWYSFFDRPLKIAGRVIKRANDRVFPETVALPYLVTIPSVAVHQNRNVNDGFSVNPQVDLLPLYALGDEKNFLSELAGENEILSHDLFLVNADMPYSFGKNNEFLASPRIDNLTSVYASLESLLAHTPSGGICVACCLDNEEVGSRTLQGAGSDFLENVLRRIAYALRFDDNEYYKALASSFLFSVDNAHAVHPNRPEKSDPTNKAVLGGGIVIKSHANKAYTTDGLSSAVAKTVFDHAGVAYQSFFNRSDAQSGSTLGAISLAHVSVMSVDIGIAQLAMHSANECFAKSDYQSMVKALTEFYSSEINVDETGVNVR